MHICIVGTGAAGWMAAAALINVDKIVEHWPDQQLSVTIIGSPEIPPIGVGESNTLQFVYFHSALGLDESELITRIDATVKTGVLYDNWSPTPFLHNFKGSRFFDQNAIGLSNYILSFKNIDTPLSEMMGYDQYKLIEQNLFHTDAEDYYPFSFHFDAAKYIDYMAEKCAPFVQMIPETVQSINYTDGDMIESLQLSDSTFTADYYIFATGSSDLPLNQNFVDLSNTLLTNKAWVYPLQYTNKREQFTPYTRAKTMKYGWRWITPTYSRIGTGYVFSDRHVSPDDALTEFLDDIGDHTIQPRLVNFHPRYATTPFHTNYATIGMASGFLEPLDAPGLSLTIGTIVSCLQYLKNGIDHYVPLSYHKQCFNNKFVDDYTFWTSFILAQYKTCYRNDTQFWIDHKNVNYSHYDHIIHTIENLSSVMRSNSFDNYHDFVMITHSMVAKGYQFNVPNLDLKPFKMPTLNGRVQHHLDYIESHHETHRKNMLRVSNSNVSYMVP